jgi:hypothetical protein
MTDHTTNAEQLHHQLARELGGFHQDVHVEALNDQDVKAISDVQIVNADEDATDPIEAAMTNAVNAPTLGSMPISNALNNAELDEAMTEYFNNRI